MVRDHSSSRLTLVDPIRVDTDANQTDLAGGLAVLLDEILQERFWARTIAARGRSGSSSADRQIPFCIRLTMEQIREVAEDAALRAEMLEVLLESSPGSAQALRKVHSLRDVAIDLREIAERLEDGWEEPAP
jgi:hypothetical protein